MKTKAPNSYYEIQSERIQCSKLTEDDKLIWQDFFVDNDHLPFVAQDPSLGKEFLSNRWIDFQLERYKKSDYGLLALRSKETGAFIGQAGLLTREINGKPEMEIAYSLLPKYWRQGYASEIALALKNYGIENEIAPRYISIIHKENHGSMAVARKHGFEILFETIYKEMDVFVFG